MITTWFFISSLWFFAEAFCKIAIGIDFGASTKVSIITNKKPSSVDFVLDEASSFKIPSKVAFTPSDIFFGHQASRLAEKIDVSVISVAETVFSVENPWEKKLLLPHSPDNLLSVTALYFNYIKSLCDDYITKIYGSTIQPDSVVISVNLLF